MLKLIKSKSIQILFLSSFILTFSANNLISDNDRKESIRKIISQLTTEEKINQLSAEFCEPIDRLGLTEYNWHNEAIRGLVTSPATIFPHCINQAASWDRDYMTVMASAISDEVRATYRRTKGKFGLNVWSPNVNMTRDPRWGRNQETYGEDPYFISEFAYLFITTMQGNDPKYKKTICTPKHFFAHSGPEKKQHSFNAVLNKKDLFETYLPPFKHAIADAKAGSLMTAFIAINGVPMHCNSYYLDTVVRKQWGFDGYITSDCWGIPMTAWQHKYTKSNMEATAAALKAGVDLECGITYNDHMLNTLKNGLIEEHHIDTSVARLLKAKYELGVIGDSKDNPYNNIPDSIVRCQKHLDIALSGAQESIVLLENKNNILPLKKNQTRVFITGPYSNISWQLYGSYNGFFDDWIDGTVKVMQAFRNKYSDSSMVKYISTCQDMASVTTIFDSNMVKTQDGEKGFLGEYFPNLNLKGLPAYTRIDKKMDFDWGLNAPFDNFPSDSFSVRWTGYITPDTTDYYSFRVRGDDGYNVYVNDSLILNAWDYNRRDARSAIILLDSGKTYKITLEYQDIAWHAWVQFGMGNTSTWDKDLERQADSLAQLSDVIVFVGGISAEYESEHTSLVVDGFDHGDRTHINLPLIQRKFLKMLHKTGKPVILALLNGSCLGLNWEKENLAAIVDAFYPGERGGQAIADVIYGDVNPSGKLPITFYKSVEDLPDARDYSLKDRTYRYFQKEVLYPFGYGLSYTKYKYFDAKIEKNVFDQAVKDTLRASIRVKNIGGMDGKEIVQIYAQKPGSTNYDAIKQLVEFSKKSIKAGEETIYSYSIPIERLCYYDTTKSKYRVENGEYKLLIGASSQDIKFELPFTIKGIAPEESSVKESQKIGYEVSHNQALNQVIVSYNNHDQSFDPNAITPQMFDILGREIPISHHSNSSSITMIYPSIENGVYILKLNNTFIKLLINKQ